VKGRGSADVVVLTHALEKLRAREGVTLARLEGDAHGVAEPLLNLTAVRRYASIHNIEHSQAALAVVTECVRDGLGGSHRIVADAVLALGIFAEEHYRHYVGARVLDALRSDLLSRRRRALLANWPRLHEALGVVPVDAPSDRTLRGSLEGAVLAELARLLIRREVSSRAYENTASGLGDLSPRSDAQRPRGRVIVVGGAVMDATFRTRALPERDTTREAYGFVLSPGGKGLTQAVAAARLGLDVSLLAAVTEDRFGQEIVEYLEDQGVDTSMLKYVSDAKSPFTGVIEFEQGDSIAVNWRNEEEVRLDIRDLERFGSHLLASDAVLVTFELPLESMERTLELTHGPELHRPLKIVVPAHPYDNGIMSGQALAKIDYLVAHPWELGPYAPPNRTPFDLDAVAQRIIAFGVGTLCVPTGGGCTIYSKRLGTFAVPTFVPVYKESQAARDAFCAALVAKLIEAHGEFSEQVALWATAAMAAATADYPAGKKPKPLTSSMPDRSRVEQLLNSARFEVTPRSLNVTDTSLGTHLALTGSNMPTWRG
jgi:ribokinase